MSNHWVHAAHHASKHGGKAGAVVLIIIGFFLAPMLIGIPLIIWGVVKLFSK
jgi:hypothetical protein